MTNVGRIRLADADQDGDLDLFASSHIGSELLWFENDGVGTNSGSFTRHDISHSAQSISSLCPGATSETINNFAYFRFYIGQCVAQPVSKVPQDSADPGGERMTSFITETHPRLSYRETDGLPCTRTIDELVFSFPGETFVCKASD